MNDFLQAVLIVLIIAVIIFALLGFKIVRHSETMVIASAGETVGGQFGEDQRAYMIGATPTAGMSSQKTRVKAPSGMFTAYFSVHSNKARFNRGRGIEGVGVQPHEIVPNDPADAAAGIDTQLKRACEILTKGIPAGVIDYVPPVPQETQAEERQPEE